MNLFKFETKFSLKSADSGVVKLFASIVMHKKFNFIGIICQIVNCTM